MKIKDSQAGSAHLIVIGIVFVLIIAALGWAAWRHFDHQNNSLSAAKPQETAQTISFKTPIKINEQGDCHLTMKDASGKVVLTQQNSTKGKSGETGCETWQLDKSKLSKGAYHSTVEFEGGGKKVVNTFTTTFGSIV